jgi:hypothetical protein
MSDGGTMSPSQSLPRAGVSSPATRATVLEVLEDAGGRIAAGAEEAAVIHDADDAAGVGDGAELFVVDVPPVRVHAGDAGVGDEERAGAVVGRRPRRRTSAGRSCARSTKTRWWSRRRTNSRPAAERTGGAAAAGPARRAERRRGEMDDGHLHDGAVRERVERGAVPIERVPALDAEKRGVASRRARGLVVGRRPHDRDAGRAREDTAQAGEVRDEGRSARRRRAGTGSS